MRTLTPPWTRFAVGEILREQSGLRTAAFCLRFSLLPITDSERVLVTAESSGTAGFLHKKSLCRDMSCSYCLAGRADFAQIDRGRGQSTLNPWEAN